VGVTGPEWSSGPLLWARTHRERRRGLRPRPLGRGLLLASRSVHGWGMKEPLRVVSLDAAGRVRRVAFLAPGRVFCDAGARWIIELPVSRPAPQVGMMLRLQAAPGKLGR
jgi:hypothetical protein